MGSCGGHKKGDFGLWCRSPAPASPTKHRQNRPGSRNLADTGRVKTVPQTLPAPEVQPMAFSTHQGAGCIASLSEKSPCSSPFLANQARTPSTWPFPRAAPSLGMSQLRRHFAVDPPPSSELKLLDQVEGSEKDLLERVAKGYRCHRPGGPMADELG